MDHHIRVATDWRCEVSVQRDIQGIVMIEGVVRVYACAEILGVLGVDIKSK